MLGLLTVDDWVRMKAVVRAEKLVFEMVDYSAELLEAWKEGC